MSRDVANAMDIANKEITRILNEVPKERIQSIVDERLENNQRMKEIDEQFARMNLTDVSVEEELAQLEEDISKENAEEAVRSIPEAPCTTVESVTSTKETVTTTC